MINEYVNRLGYNEDGDMMMRRIIEVDTIQEAREMTKTLEDEVNRHGSRIHYDIKWVGKGGKLEWEDTWTVDGAEIAIEASNDYYASMRYDPYDGDRF